jgi:hypothetical protein
MNFVTRPPIEANGSGHAGDDLDEALFAFFRSEMPRPWPRLRLPAGARPPVRPAQPAPAPSRRPWFRSPRFVLAASVALLIAGYAAMSAALTPPSPSDNTFNDPAASRKSIKDVMEPKDPAEGNVRLRPWLEQNGNKPTTFHIEAEAVGK